MTGITFDDVYLCAKKAKNKEDFDKKIAILKITKDNLDSLKEGVPFPVSPAGQLAFEGEDERATWLMNLGADKNMLAAGYARAGKDKKVAEITVNKPNIVAQGYAVGGFVDLESKVEIKPEHIPFLIRAYAAAGNHKMVEKKRAEYVLKLEEKSQDKDKCNRQANLKAAIGYAVAGDVKRAESYIPIVQKEKISPEDTKEAMELVKAYIWARNGKKVKQLFEAYALEMPEIKKIYDELNPQRAGLLVKTEGEMTRDEFAKALVQPIPEKPSKIEIKGSTPKEKLESLFESYLDQRLSHVDSKDKTKQYFYGSFFAPLQKSLHEKKLAIEAVRGILNGEEGIDISTHLSTLKNGNLGKALKDFVKSGEAKKLFDGDASFKGEVKIDSVDDFVKILGKKTRTKSLDL